LRFRNYWILRLLVFVIHYPETAFRRGVEFKVLSGEEENEAMLVVRETSEGEGVESATEDAETVRTVGGQWWGKTSE